MATEVKSETIDLNGQNVLLISVKNGESAIGTCTAGYIPHNGNAGSTTRFFYIGSDPVMNIICPNNGNKNADKLISFCPGYQGYEPKIHEALSASFSRLNRGDALSSALRDIFGILQDGVYVAYTADYYPTDGSGVFFWGAYNISHEVRGTAEHNRSLGGDKTYKPCFLLPTQPLDYFAPKTKANADEAIKRRKYQGIVYHLSGFHSALLKGHHGAAACVEKDVPFRCAVIERITEAYTEKREPVPVQEKPAAPAEGEQQTQEETAAPAPAPAPEHEGITGFRSASVKIPLEVFPHEMLRNLVSGRFEYKPEFFNLLMAKLGTVRRKAVSNNILSLAILEKAEQLPDINMVESAYAITSLSDEELGCLLAGEVEHNGEIIVSPNFYASIVTACNFLQFTDTDRFIDFAVAIMDNPELIATHEYVAHRAGTLESNGKLYNYFKSVTESGDEKYEKVLPAAKTFVERYKANNK